MSSPPQPAVPPRAAGYWPTVFFVILATVRLRQEWEDDDVSTRPAPVYPSPQYGCVEL